MKAINILPNAADINDSNIEDIKGRMSVEVLKGILNKSDVVDIDGVVSDRYFNGVGPN